MPCSVDVAFGKFLKAEELTAYLIRGPSLAMGCMGTAGTWAADFTDTAILVLLLKA